MQRPFIVLIHTISFCLPSLSTIKDKLLCIRITSILHFFYHRLSRLHRLADLTTNGANDTNEWPRSCRVQHHSCNSYNSWLRKKSVSSAKSVVRLERKVFNSSILQSFNSYTLTNSCSDPQPPNLGG